MAEGARGKDRPPAVHKQTGQTQYPGVMARSVAGNGRGRWRWKEDKVLGNEEAKELRSQGVGRVV